MAFHRLCRLVFVALRCWETNSLQRKAGLAAKGGDRNVYLNTCKLQRLLEKHICLHMCLHICICLHICLHICQIIMNKLRWDKEGVHVTVGVGINNLSIKNDKFQNSIWDSLTKLQNKNYRFVGCTWRSVNAQRRVWGTGNMEDMI